MPKSALMSEAAGPPKSDSPSSTPPVDAPILHDAVEAVWGPGLSPDRVHAMQTALTTARAAPSEIVALAREGRFSELNTRLSAADSLPETPVTDAQWNDLASALLRTRVSTTLSTAGCAVFTAPHCLEVTRIGWPWHKREDYTGTLAIRAAAHTLGGCIVWRDEERRRVKALVAARGGTNGEGPDDTNADPNFLSTDDVRRQCKGPPNGLWTQLLVEQRSRIDGPALHVDFHGMGRVGADECVIGLGALRVANPDLAARFHTALTMHLSPLACFGGDGTGLVVGQKGDRLQGCWGRETGRCTLTQQSLCQEAFAIGDEAFTAAVQIEMTMALRKRLVQSPGEHTAFVEALLAAFHAALTTTD